MVFKIIIQRVCLKYEKEETYSHSYGSSNHNHSIYFANMLGLNLEKLFLKLIIAILLLIGIAWGAISLYKNLTATNRTEKAVLSILKSEDLSFLVTDKLTSQICVEISENSPLLGKREGILIGTVTMYWGIDLSKINPALIRKTTEGIIIPLPNPGELDFSVDLSSLKYITKRSGLNVIADFVMNRDIEKELRDQMQQSALKFFKDHNLIPSKAKTISKLNSYFSPIAQQIGMPITFE